ncbi:unnamed protein product [Parascedosporium putredinis]|uniref:Aminotransferase n=1 Tax=Parascedosporium putredinis TaxID=1442378 RepID=A0A9P1H4R7_9PEZI|nr:unnamed protein product [Parascedosporium putredinis]CAI7995895.1 unnamed protein product [Parascedosporium putredinis]
MEPFHIFTTLRYDAKLEALHNDPNFAHAGWNYRRASSCYMLDFHRDRMLRAATYWDWTAALGVLSGDAALARLETAVLQAVTAAGRSGEYARVRILVGQDGQIEVEASGETEKQMEDLFPRGLAAPVEAAGGGMAGAPSPTFTVFLDGDETEKSEFTHYKTTRRAMYNGARERAGIKLGEPKEVLLAADDGGVMEGSVTTPYFWRQESGYAVEEAVPSSSLVDGELIWLSNGAKGFLLGKLQGKV